ncbi:hypothetical protein BYT27DRAFT_7260201 [Phlegmacium glaucopus]|nr:hypothetical protein BYT27DRAFT_7260201 [Phlegmacium glaucopus]
MSSPDFIEIHDEPDIRGNIKTVLEALKALAGRKKPAEDELSWALKWQDLLVVKKPPRLMVQFQFRIKTNLWVYRFGLARSFAGTYGAAAPEFVNPLAHFERNQCRRPAIPFLESALTAAGAEYVKCCEYAFDDKFLYDCVNLSETLETVGTRAHTGVIQYISKMLTAPLPPLSLQQLRVMLHGLTWHVVNRTLRTPHSRPLSLSTKSTSSSPTSSSMTYPQLTLAPELIPGHETLLSFSLENEQLEEHLYVAFLSGAVTIFALLSKKEGAYVVEIPDDLRAAGTIFVVVFKGEKRLYWTM